MVPELVFPVELVDDRLAGRLRTEKVHEGLGADPAAAGGDKDDDPSVLQGRLAVVQGFLGLIEVDVVGFQGHGDHDVRLPLDGDNEDLVGPGQQRVKRLLQVAGGRRVDAVLAVENRHDCENIQLFKNLLGVVELLRNGVSLEDHRLGSRRDSKFVVCRDAVVARHSRHEALPAPGVPGKVMGFDAPDRDDGVGVPDEGIEPQVVAVSRLAERVAGALFGIVDVYAVLDLPVERPEDEVVFLPGRGPVTPRGDEDLEVPAPEQRVDDPHDGVRRRGACRIIDEQKNVPAVPEKLLDPGRAERVENGAPERLLLVDGWDGIGDDHLFDMAVGQLDPFDAVPVGDLQLHDTLQFVDPRPPPGAPPRYERTRKLN